MTETITEVDVDFNNLFGGMVDGVYEAFGVRFSIDKTSLKVGDRAFFYSSGERNEDGSQWGFYGVVEKVDGPLGCTGYARIDWTRNHR